MPSLTCRMRRGTMSRAIFHRAAHDRRFGLATLIVSMVAASCLALTPAVAADRRRDHARSDRRADKPLHGPGTGRSRDGRPQCRCLGGPCGQHVRGRRGRAPVRALQQGRLSHGAEHRSFGKHDAAVPERVPEGLAYRGQHHRRNPVPGFRGEHPCKRAIRWPRS